MNIPAVIHSILVAVLREVADEDAEQMLLRFSEMVMTVHTNIATTANCMVLNGARSRRRILTV